MEKQSLVLGTAQLGFPYGIANTSGKPDMKTAAEIVEKAWTSGIEEFDTAQGYGDSERVLGKALAELGFAGKAKIITKLAPTLNYQRQDSICNEVRESMDRLGCDSLYGLMVHDEIWLDYWEAGLHEILSDLQKSGLVEHLGVSVYSPARALQALDLQGLDMVQIPANLFDRRFINAGVLERAEEKRKKIYVRSVFLQGLLLMDPDQIPDTLKQARPFIERLGRIAADGGLEQRELALAYIRTSCPDAGIVIGVELPEQIESNVRGWKKILPSGLLEEINVSFADIGEDIVNPALWKTAQENDNVTDFREHE